METSAGELSVEDSSEPAKDDSTTMISSDVDASKENSLSVSLFVHTDDVQDDLDDDLKEAAAAAAKSQEEEVDTTAKGFRTCSISSLFSLKLVHTASKN